MVAVATGSSFEETPMGTAAIPPWRIKVHSFEACNCNTGCGCRFGGLPDYGSCEAMHAFEVIEGRYGGVELAGLRVVIAGKWPAAVFEGHGQAVLFVETSAPPDQVDAAWMIFSGQAGSRLWTWYASTFEVFEGPVRVPIEMTVNGRRSHVRIAEQLEVGLVPLRHRVSGAEREVHIVYPAGTGGFWDDGDIATTTTMRVNHGALTFQHPDRFAAYAVAEWSNQ
jgi:hypothetical protein